MKTFKDFISEQGELGTIAAKIWPNGFWSNPHDVMIANMHMVNRVDYPVPQKQADLPFKDNSIQHRTGYRYQMNSDSITDDTMAQEEIETLLARELSESENVLANTLAEEMLNTPELVDVFEEQYGPLAVKAIYAATRKMVFVEEVVEEQVEVSDTFHQLLEYKETGSSSVEVTPKDEASALVLAKKYTDMAKSADDPKVKEEYERTAQRFFNTANRLRSAKKNRMGEPKKRLKEETYQDLVAFLEHIIATGEEVDVIVENEEETLTITPDQAGRLYNQINALDESEREAFVEVLTGSNEAFTESLQDDYDAAANGPHHHLYKAYDRNLKLNNTNHTKFQARKFFGNRVASDEQVEKHIKGYEEWKKHN